jgi:dihydrofolate synthase/folylpolyglutamate synthase
MQQLHGALAALLPPTWQLWLDGGHNQGAAAILADQLAAWSDRPVHLLIGMKQTKNPASFLAPLLPHAATAWAIAEPGQHLALPIETLIAAAPTLRPGPDLHGALSQLAGPPARVLICGSLHLAGEALKHDGTQPD